MDKDPQILIDDFNFTALLDKSQENFERENCSVCTFTSLFGNLLCKIIIFKTLFDHMTSVNMNNKLAVNC